MPPLWEVGPPFFITACSFNLLLFSLLSLCGIWTLILIADFWALFGVLLCKIRTSLCTEVIRTQSSSSVEKINSQSSSSSSYPNTPFAWKNERRTEISPWLSHLTQWWNWKTYRSWWRKHATHYTLCFFQEAPAHADKTNAHQRDKNGKHQKSDKGTTVIRKPRRNDPIAPLPIQPN